jgi:hypothetical protein
VIEPLDHPLDDLRELDIDIGLHGDIDLGTLPVETCQPRQTVQGVPDRGKSRQCNLERAFFFSLGDNLIDP